MSKFNTTFFEIDKIDSSCPIILEECLKPSQHKIFRETVNNYHSYCKFKESPTRRICWNAYENTGNLVGSISLSSASIAVSVRDNYIGWDNKIKMRHLGKLANNQRCCFIRDNFTMKNVGSMTLKQLRIIGAKRWLEKYGEPLILIETFILPQRENELNGYMSRSGSLYKADNWIDIGLTVGASLKKAPSLMWKKETGFRGNLARTNLKEALKRYGYGDKEYIITKSLPKMVFIKPLVKNWREMLLS